MKPKTLLLMLVALGSGLTAAHLVASLKHAEAPEEVANPGGQLVRVVVFREDLREGLKIAEPEKSLKCVHYRKGDEPKGFYSDVAALKDRVLARPVNADQPVKDTDLRPK